MLPLLNINSASVIGWLESAAAQQWIVGILLVLLFISFIKEWMPVEIHSPDRHRRPHAHGNS